MATINVNKHILDLGQVFFTFGWDGEPLPDDVEKVNLSRHGTNPACWFRPDQVHIHDGHAPVFQDEEAAKAYLDRVEADVKSALAGLNGQVEE